MEIAAQEFALYGYSDSSMNRILENAEMSKGAAYYYFENKIDLFLTVIQYCNERLRLIDEELNLATLTTDNFWSIFATLRREPLLRSYKEPWLFAAIKSAGKLSAQEQESKPLAILAEEIRTWIMSIIKQGQQLNVIRTDITNELIFTWLQAIDDASDQWLLTNWEQLDCEDIKRNSNQTVDAMRRMLEP